MKKLRNLLAVVSAVVISAVSITPFVSNARIGGWIYSPDQTVTPYTVSFTVNEEEKYVLWQEASDYLYNMDVESEPFEDNGHLTCFRGSTTNVFISEKPFKVKIFDEETGELIGYRESYGMYGYSTTYWGIDEENIIANSQCCPLAISNEYWLKNEEDKAKLESYLIENNIPYTISDNTIELQFDIETTIYEKMKVYSDIKENTGIICEWGLLESAVQIADVENALPEKTLDGDANEDGVVDIADATAIIQHIGNPGKYGLTIQGMANADCYNTGDGVTGMDAIAIQKLEAGLIESFDEA